MTAPDLAYHLRELRADLRSAIATLDKLGDGHEIRGWVELEALIEHDLEVHLDAASQLAGGASAADLPAQGEPGERDAAAALRALLGLALESVTEPLALPAARHALEQALTLARDGRRHAAPPADADQ